MVFGVTEATKIFDAVVVPNELCAKRYRPFMDDSALRVLGSPRYNSAWLAILNDLLPAYEFGAHDGLNIVLFLRSPQYPIFWQEVERTIRSGTTEGVQGPSAAGHHSDEPSVDRPFKSGNERE